MFYISTLLHFVFRILSASLGLSLIHCLCTGCSAASVSCVRPGHGALHLVGF